MPPIAVLVALADPTRCRIIEILREGAQPVHVLAGHFDISRPAISRHLRVLKQARLISEKKLGRENRYALHQAKLKPVRDWLEAILPVAADLPAAKDPAKTKKVAPRKPVIPAPLATLPEPPQAPTRPTSQMGFDF